MKKFKNIETVKFMDFVKSPKRIIYFLMSILFLYFGLFSFLIYPIIDLIKEPTVTNAIWTLFQIFVLSGIFVGIGSVLGTMSFIKSVNPVIK